MNPKQSTPFDEIKLQLGLTETVMKPGSKLFASSWFVVWGYVSNLNIVYEERQKISSVLKSFFSTEEFGC